MSRCRWRCSAAGFFFILRAHGYSMVEAGIEPGDMVVVKKQNTANEGDIVVALVGKATPRSNGIIRTRKDAACVCTRKTKR